MQLARATLYAIYIVLCCILSCNVNTLYCVLQGLGKTCMYCGDGINDLVALACADLGVAIGAGDAAAAAAFSTHQQSIGGNAFVLLSQLDRDDSLQVYSYWSLSSFCPSFVFDGHGMLLKWVLCMMESPS